MNILIKTGKTAKLIGGTMIVIGVLTSCQSNSLLSPSETIQQGYIIDEETLAMVPVGSSKEQVLLSLGTPSTINNLDGNPVFYYISQTRKRAFAFQKTQLVDQRVMAVYFSADGTVSNIAHYGLKDGKVFDFIKRVTPTSGKDNTFLMRMLKGGAKPMFPVSGQ